MEKENFTCPITKRIFLKPVVASNGLFYEKEALEEKLKYDTTLKIRHYHETTIMEQYLQELMEEHPEYIKERYVELSVRIKALNDLNNYDNISYDDFCVLLRHVQCNLVKNPLMISGLKYTKYHNLFFKTEYLLRFIEESPKSLLENRIDDNMSLIHLMCSLCNETIIAALVKKNVDFSIKCNKNVTCLHLALIHNEKACQLILVQHSCVECCCSDNESQTSIHIAIRNSDDDVVLAIIDKLGPKQCINHQDMYGNTCLHIALESSNTDIQLALLKKGMDVFVKNNRGVRPIDIILESTNPDILRETREIVKGTKMLIMKKSYYVRKISKKLKK